MAEQAPARDNQRVLGTLFLVWSVIQLAVTGWLVRSGWIGELRYPVIFWGATAVLVLAYVLVGLELRAGEPKVRSLAILLSVFALFSFPLGTAMGAWGLYVLLRRARQPQA